MPEPIDEGTFFWIVVESLAGWGYCPGSNDVIDKLESGGLAVRLDNFPSGEYAELTPVGRNHFEHMGKPMPTRRERDDEKR